MTCYYHEIFGLGIVSALLIIILVVMFEYVIKGWLRRFKRFIGVGGV